MIDLVHVDFNLTNACNLACAHCHSSSGTALDHELTTDEIVDVVRQLHARGVLSVAFAGGEPFMRPDLITILEEACRLDGWRVSVITNGLFFSDRMVESLKDRCPAVGINVSIDGSAPDTFAVLRAQPRSTPAARAALFRRVTEGVRKATSAGLQVSVNTTMTRATIHDLVPTYRLAVEELGAAAQVAIKFFPAGYGREHLEQFEFPWRVWAAEFQQLTRLKIEGSIPHMQLSVPSAWEFYLPLIEGNIDLAEAETAWSYRGPLREEQYRRNRSLGDVAGVAELCISGDGLVYPSVLMAGDERVQCGSVRDQTVDEIWNTAGNLIGLRSLEIRDLANCASCDMAALCGGGSRSRALADHGNIAADDTSCPLIRSVATTTGESR
jgi:radical SAM protein with 4Fe4S-binding SPASM domain